MPGIQVLKRAKAPARWINCLHLAGSPGSSNQAMTAGTVYLYMFEVTEACMVDAIVFLNGTTATGTIIVGVYGPLVTEDTCAGAPLKGQSASVTQTGTSVPQIYSLATPVLLTPGRYYAALESSSSSATVLRGSQVAQVTGYGQAYVRSGGYGALTDPCPTISETTGIAPGIRVRCTPITV